MYKAIVNAKIITPLEIIINGGILIDSGKIRKVIRNKGKIPKNIEIIDAEGKILCPGFIDLHLEGGGGADVIDGTFEAINCVSSTHLKYGTTSFLATILTRPNKSNSLRDEKFLHLKPIVQAIKRRTDGAQILGIHLEGPFINPKRKGMIRRDYVRKPNIQELREIIRICKGNLKMMTIAPELEGNLTLIKELVKNGSLLHWDIQTQHMTNQ